MKKSIITLLFLAMAIPSFSQNMCNCKQSLNQLIEKLENYYPGFNEKTQDTILYNDFKDRLIIRAGDIVGSDCPDLLEYYLSYFRDPHIRLEYSNHNETQTSKVSSSKVNVTLDDFNKHISKSSDELEGVWKSPAYKVGIIKEKNNYQGFIIEASNSSWKPYEIKFSLMENGKVNYYMGNHSLQEDNFEVFDGSILSFKNISSVFIKESPKPRLTQKEIESKLDKIQGFYFTKLTDKTSLLCISSFEDPYVKKIEKIISDNQNEIENCENLIIDVRNNLGGTYDAYDEVLPYILTNNVRDMGTEFMVTQELIDSVEDWFDDEEGKKEARRWISLFKGNIGKFVNVDTATNNISIIKVSENSPKQIAILVNKRTASSGEAFILTAKQSKKVKILGIPTYGAIDYGSASYFEFGCKNYKLMMPTWRSMRLPDFPLDNIGVQPDIYLDETIKDWVQYTVDYLEN